MREKEAFALNNRNPDILVLFGFQRKILIQKINFSGTGGVREGAIFHYKIDCFFRSKFRAFYSFELSTGRQKDSLSLSREKSTGLSKRAENETGKGERKVSEKKTQF